MLMSSVPRTLRQGLGERPLAVSAVYWRPARGEISKFVEDVGGDPGSPKIWRREGGHTKQLTWRRPRSLIPHARPPMTLRCHPNAVGDRAPHSHCLPHRFFFGVYHGYYYLMSSVGVSAPPISSFLPQGESSPIFAPRWTFILFYSVSPELIPLSCKNAPLPSCSLYTCLEFSEATALTTDDPCYPTHHIARSSNRHPLFRPFFLFLALFNIWLATFMSIALRLAIICTSPPHHPSHFPSLRFAFRSSRWRFPWVRPFGQRLADAVRSWGFAPQPVSVSFLPQRTNAVPFVRIISSFLRLSCRWAVIDPISSFCELVV